MKRRVAQLILVLALTLSPRVSAWAGTAISLSEFRQQLQDFSRQVDALTAHPEDIPRVGASIPEEVIVRTGSVETTVSYRDLKNDLITLGRADEAKRSAGLRQIRNYLETLSAEAEKYDQSADLNDAHKKLDDILARREFKHARGTSLRDVLLSRLFDWLSRVLGRLLSRANPAIDWLTILIYVLIAVAMLLLVLWTIRRFRRGEDDSAAREIVPFVPSARSWRAWLEEARRVAQQEDWRNAIHLAYWAGISFLESGGAWKPNRARTPREYLRLLGTRKPEYPSLAALTRKFEIVWYGARNAGRVDFQETLGQLEKLGCR